MIHRVPSLTHNTMNKNFDKLALLYKISCTAELKNIVNFILTASHLQMLPDLLKDLIKLLVFSQVIRFLNSLPFTSMTNKTF